MIKYYFFSLCGINFSKQKRKKHYKKITKMNKKINGINRLNLRIKIIFKKN